MVEQGGAHLEISIKQAGTKWGLSRDQVEIDTALTLESELILRIPYKFHGKEIFS